MKKDEVRIGSTYRVKVSGNVVPVKITAEKWSGDKHTGWVGTNTETGRSVRVKSAQRLRAEVGGKPAKPEKPEPPTPAAAEPPQAVAAAPDATAANVGEPAANGAGAAPAAESAKKASPAPKAAKAKAPKHAKAAKADKAKPPKAEKPKRLSALDAAAQVLAKAGAPMKAKAMLDAMVAKGLWKSPAGKTPEATLYAAIIREIAAKGREARFVKTERGTFAARKAG